MIEHHSDMQIKGKKENLLNTAKLLARTEGIKFPKSECIKFCQLVHSVDKAREGGSYQGIWRPSSQFTNVPAFDRSKIPISCTTLLAPTEGSTAPVNK